VLSGNISVLLLHKEFLFAVKIYFHGSPLILLMSSALQMMITLPQQTGHEQGGIGMEEI
jgi:hypothetical protein